MFRFQHFEYFWLFLLLPLVVLIYLSFLKWSKSRFKKLGDTELTTTLLKGKIKGRRTTKFVLLLLALFCSILAMANLQMGGHAEKGEKKGIDVFFVLDVSKSMLAQDFSPNRLTQAKQFIYRMIDKMPNDRVGLIVFAGKAYLQVPLTIDFGAMKMLLSSVDPEMIPTQGTVISKALNLANSSFTDNQKKHKAVILISDGEDHDEKAATAAKELANSGTVIYTVGVGSPKGSTIYDPSTGQAKLDRNGKVVITKLNEEELKAIAQNGKGSYHLLSNTDQTADQIVSELNEMQTKSLGEVVFTDYDSYFQYFLGAALFFLLLDWFLPVARVFQKEGEKNIKNERIRKTTLLFLFVILMPAFVFAQSRATRTGIKEGNGLYKQKLYDSAQKSYEKVLEKAPDSYKATFNLGDALYQKKDFDGARKAFNNSIQATDDKTLKAKAYHNMGNTFMEEKQWQDAANAYKNALKLNENDSGSKYNLAYAQAMLRKQKQNQKKNNKNQNKEQQKQDQKQKQKEKQKNKDGQKKEKEKSQQQKQQDQKNKDQEKKGQQHSKPMPSKLTKQEAQNILNALNQEEQQLHDKRKKGKGEPVQLGKDW